MNKTTKIILGLIILIIVIVLVTIFYKPAAKGTIKIGAVLSLTGIAQNHGQNDKDGIDLAVKEINASGGINGRKIEVIYEDDATDAKNTVTIVHKFINIDKVSVIIGPTWDFLANAAIPVIDQGKVVTITPSVLGDAIDVTSPYFFSTFSPIAYKQGAVEKFLDGLQSKKIGILVVNNTWALAHLDTYKKAISNTGNILTKQIILPEFDNNEMSSELTILKDLHLDAILTCLNDRDSVNFLRKVKELDIQAKILGNEHFGDITKNKLLDMATADGIYFTDFSTPQKKFVENFKKVYGKEPGLYSDTAYDTVYLLAEVIRKYGDSSWNIREGLKKIKYSGASGEISFDKNNYPNNKQFELILIKNGQFVPYSD